MLRTIFALVGLLAVLGLLAIWQFGFFSAKVEEVTTHIERETAVARAQAMIRDTERRAEELSDRARQLSIDARKRELEAQREGESLDKTRRAMTPLTDRLAQTRQTLENRQQRRRELLKQRKVQLAQLTADLKTGIRRSGLALEEALQRFAGGPGTGPLAELTLLYRRCAQLEVHVQRLDLALSKDRVLIGRLRLSEDNVRQQAELDAALAPADQKATEDLLTEADDADAFNVEEVLADPALAADLDAAFRQVQDTLRRRVALLPGRAERSTNNTKPLSPGGSRRISI